MVTLRNLPELVPIVTKEVVSGFLFLDYRQGEKGILVRPVEYYVPAGNPIRVEIMPFVRGRGFFSQLEKIKVPDGDCIGYVVEEITISIKLTSLWMS